MSTRSAIIEHVKGNQYRGIYCHSDGYLSYNGRMLLQHWTDPAKVHALINLGDISCLGEEIGEKHSFDAHHGNKAAANWTLSYTRDRGETGCAPIRGTLDQVVTSLKASDAEFFYVFDGKGAWKFSEERFAMHFAPLTADIPSIKKVMEEMEAEKPVILAPIAAQPATEPAQSRRHLTTAEIRAILKANGIRSNRATVKCGSSLTYITVTIRDASVSAARVNKLLASKNTWSMSMDDCVTGQSITVENSSYVEDVLAEPYLQTVQNATIPDHDGGGEYIVPGVILWRSRNDCYVASNSGHRGSNVWLRDLEQRDPAVVRRLAIQIADILDRQANEGSQSPSVRSAPAVAQPAVVPAPPEFSTTCYIG